MGVFYLCLHTVGLVRMEVVWVCFICVYINRIKDTLHNPTQPHRWCNG